MNAAQADTYSLKGFVTIGDRADNTVFATAPFGELSLRSATFSKDRTYYSIPSAGTAPTTLSLSVFSSKDEAGDVVEPITQYTDLVLSLSRWLHDQILIQGALTTIDQIRQAINAEYGTQIRDLAIGPLVSDGVVSFPSGLSFYVNVDEVIGTDPVDFDPERSRIRLWFADQYFSNEYDEYNLEFIAPIDTLDDFFGTAGQVEALLNQRTLTETMAKVEERKDGKPETILRTLSFDYVDPQDRNHRIPTNWTFVIYSAAGDNIDALKAGLAEWILDNSTRPREEWALILPDIFTSTEILITPMWSQFGIPNQTLIEGMYSPIVNLQMARTIAKRTAAGTGYTEAHIDAVLSVTGATYKSLALLAVGGPENRMGLDRLEEIWPDYLLVTTDSVDFDRMSLDTQRWVDLLHRLLLCAETMTDYSDMPQGITRLRRQNSNGEVVLFAAASYANIQYLVVSRQTMQSYFPPQAIDALRLTVEGVEGVDAMPNAEADIPYTTRFVGIGGTEPYTYDIVQAPSTAYIDALDLDPDTGVLTGLPIGTGDVEIEVGIQDFAGTRITKVFKLHIYRNQP